MRVQISQPAKLFFIGSVRCKLVLVRVCALLTPVVWMVETPKVKKTMSNDNVQFFEGVEKLLEIWFTSDDNTNKDLRKIPRLDLENDRRNAVAATYLQRFLFFFSFILETISSRY